MIIKWMHPYWHWWFIDPDACAAEKLAFDPVEFRRTLAKHGVQMVQFPNESGWDGKMHPYYTEPSE